MEAYRKGWAAYATQRFGEAEKWLEISIRSDPENAHSHALLGDLAYLRHDLGNAKASWEKALKLNPHLRELQNQIAQAELELQLERSLKPVPWEGLTIRIPSDLPPKDEQLILQNLSEAKARLKDHFQYAPQRPLTVLIYPEKDFYATTHLPMEVLGLFDGKIRIPRQSDIASVLWHEYTHVVVYDLSHGRAPRWLHEGLAQECEEMSQSSRQGGTPRNDAKQMPPLRQLMGIPDRPGEVVVMPASPFYSASHSLVRYLLETWGWDRLRAFLKSLGGGQSVEEALQEIYGWDLDTLERKWNAWG